MWKNDKLKTVLFDIAGLKRKQSFFIVPHTNEMKSACEQAHMKKEFHKDLDTEKIVAYKGKYNEFLCVFCHIRNAFAHGRLAMYERNGDITFTLEDGVKRRNGQSEVLSRMVLKKSTLKRWMDVLKSDRLPSKT